MTRRSNDLESLERALGYEFDDRGQLIEALTHSSAAGSVSNERLEFLGDRVLGLIVAQALITRFPEEAEGALAPRFNALVRKEACAEIAERIGLGAYLSMARSEAKSGGRRKQTLLGDAMEALIAAVFLDGGLKAAEDLVLRLWQTQLNAQVEAPIDAKTALQEWVQARAMPLPHYLELSREGPDHQPQFEVKVVLENGMAATGEAGSKREAQQAAANALLKRLEGRP